METKNNALVIGRFQLVGNHHADLLEQIVEYHHEKEKMNVLNIGVGVANTIDMNNVFSATECLGMIKPLAEKAAKKMNIPTRYRLIDDINDPPNYERHVREIFGFDLRKERVTLFSSNQYTTQCFENYPGYTVVIADERIGQHSTDLRKLVLNGQSIDQYIPDQVSRFLEEHNAKKRLEKSKYDNPAPTVDLVIEYKGKIVLIERSEPPYGVCLPGGHVEVGESCENAAIREGKEETGLDIRIKKLIGVYSDPGRDPRSHKISVAYSAKGYGTLCAGSDAKRTILATLDGLPPLVFDHKQILSDYARIKNE